MVSWRVDSPFPLVSGLPAPPLQPPQSAIFRRDSRIAAVSGRNWALRGRPAPLHSSQPARAAAEERRVFHAIRAGHVQKRPAGLASGEMVRRAMGLDSVFRAWSWFPGWLPGFLDRSIGGAYRVVEIHKTWRTRRRGGTRKKVAPFALGTSPSMKRRLCAAQSGYPWGNFC